MLGQPVSLTLPQVVGCKLVGAVNPLTTSIDIVLGITKVTLPFSPPCYRSFVSAYGALGADSGVLFVSNATLATSAVVSNCSPLWVCST